MRYLFFSATKAVLLFGAALCCVTPALADQWEDQHDSVVNEADFGEAIVNVMLDKQSGMAGAPEQISDADLNARLNDNIVYSSINGNNSIGKGAFVDTMGFPTVIQNSGNNVIIQNNTILNVTLQQ